MKRNKSDGFTSFNGASLQLFSKEDLHQLHLGTLEILERTGLKIDDSVARDYFEKAGAFVDRESSTVRIPSYLVEEAIQSAPSSVFLVGKKTEYDIILEEGRVIIALLAAGLHLWTLRPVN